MFYKSDMSAPVCSVLSLLPSYILQTPNSSLCTCSLINRDANRARSSWYLENLGTIIYCLLSIHSFTFRHLKEYDFYRLLTSFQYSAYGQNRSLHNKLWGTCGNILGENYKNCKNENFNAVVKPIKLLDPAGLVGQFQAWFDFVWTTDYKQMLVQCPPRNFKTFSKGSKLCREQITLFNINGHSTNIYSFQIAVLIKVQNWISSTTL